MVAKLSKSQLAQFSPLGALNRENLGEIESKQEVRSIKPGECLFRQGEIIVQNYYLLSGEVEIVGADKEVIGTTAGGTEKAQSTLSSNNPQPMTVRAKTESTVFSINRDLLDIMLTWDQTGGYQVVDLQPTDGSGTTNSGEGTRDWMTHILQTNAFHRIPPANIQAMFMRMEAVHYKAGEVVVNQDEKGNYFYIITEGKCDVKRSSSAGSNAFKLAVLGPGDSFGEEALISRATRNATVSMATDGSMMRLSKNDFISLLNEPLLSWVSFEECSEKIAAGAQWLDVRLPAEYKSGHITDSLNIPLIFLRMKMNLLDIDQEYIVYCDTSRRSSAASFLLSEKGFTNINTLRDGLDSVPEQALTR